MDKKLANVTLFGSKIYLGRRKLFRGYDNLAERSQVLESPSLKFSESLVKKAIAKHECVILVGSCRVEYKGRARSTLEPGERIVIIKEDGATLIHRPHGYEPVNWQPSGCYLRTSMVGEVLILNAVRRNPPEALKIFFDQVYAIVTMKLMDIGIFNLHVSEKEMQEAILSEPEILEDGFRPIAYEKRVEPGFLDIYGIDSSNRFVVVEIKRVRAGKRAALQLARYVDEVRNTRNMDVRGVLAAPKISKGMQRLLATLNLEFKRVDPERCAQVLKMVRERKLRDFF